MTRKLKTKLYTHKQTVSAEGNNRMANNLLHHQTSKHIQDKILQHLHKALFNVVLTEWYKVLQRMNSWYTSAQVKSS